MEGDTPQQQTLRSVLAVSSGTLAGIVGSSLYADIDAFQTAWALWVAEQEIPERWTWQDALQRYQEARASERAHHQAG